MEEVLKGGHYNPGDNIAVSLPGGLFSFEHGTMAKVRTPEFKKMVNGHRYLLYLRVVHPANYFVSTGGAKGIFELKPDGTVGPHALYSAMAKYASNDERQFVEEARDVAKEKNEH